MCHSALRQPFNVEDIVSFVRKLYGGQVEFLRGDTELAPGLSLHLIGGHTAGLQVVRGWTKRGWVAIASATTHLSGNIEHQIPFPTVYNMGDTLSGKNRVRTLAP